MIDDARREELEVIGREMGFTMAIVFSSALDGFVDGLHAMRNANADPDEEIEAPDIKTRIEDCRECWCDICANIETCAECWRGQTQGGPLPAPCKGCKNGMRFMPIDHPRTCEEYEPYDGHNKG